jgi:hypothetical protein
MLKFSNKTKRMAIVKADKNGKGLELVFTRSRGDGSTVGLRVPGMAQYNKSNKLVYKYVTLNTEELVLALQYVTMPVDQFKEMVAAANDTVS